MSTSLLDELSVRCGCLISDLRNRCLRPTLIATLRTIQWELYDLADCSYTLSYITEIPLTFATHDEIAAYVARFF